MGGFITVKVSGYPELCNPLAYTNTEKKVIANLPKGKKMVLYLPTYRTSQKNYYKNPLDFQNFVDFLKKEHFFWIEKLRPESQVMMSAKDYPSSCSLSLDAEFDVNVILDKIDIIVTDYSSVYQKAVYFNKPMVFYTPDYKDYLANDKGLLKSFKEYIRSIRADDLDTLKERLVQAEDDSFFTNDVLKLYKTLRAEVFNDVIEYEYDILYDQIFGGN